MRLRVMMVVLVGSGLLCPTLALANEEAAKLFEEGKALLQKADFEGALKAFGEASKADAKNEEYRQQHNMLRRVMQIRDRLSEQKDADRWAAMARALRGYYYENGIFQEALALDRQAHERFHNAESATQLAETHLELGMNAEAVELLSALSDKEMTPGGRLLLGIGEARLGRVDDARAIADRFKETADLPGEALFNLACLHSLLGNQEQAAELLIRCCELTPPSRLDAFKASLKKCGDLRGLVAADRFAKVMETKSKVSESKCSSGAGCGKCPNRGGCGAAKPPADAGGKSGESAGQSGGCPNHPAGGGKP